MKTQFDPVKTWQNEHQVFTQDIEGIYHLHNGFQGNPFEDYLAQTFEIQKMIAEVKGKDLRARAKGAGWSFSKVAATDGCMVNPQFLKTWFPLESRHVEPGAGIRTENLYFFQCGMSVHDVHMALLSRGKSLPVSGSSCAQALIGAFTTGTHGSAFAGPPGTGALQDAVRGLHVIVGPKRHVWLGPSNPIVTPGFVQKLKIPPGDLLLDDDLFYSALNGLGGFGIIHGVLLEATDLFFLDAYRFYADFESLKGLITGSDDIKTFDFSRIAPPGTGPLGAGKDLYHFEVMNNIYPGKDKGAAVTLMYECRKDYVEPETYQSDSDIAGEGLVDVINNWTARLPFLVPRVIKGFFEINYPPFSNQVGTLADQNPYISYIGPGSIVCSMAMSMEHSYGVMEICKKFNTNNVPVWFELRFIPKVNGAKAVLGFQRFEHNCVFEIAGFGNKKVLKYINLVLAELHRQKVPFGLHWGKYLPLGPDETKYGFDGPMEYVLDGDRLKEMYGKDGKGRYFVDVWRNSRDALFQGDKDMMRLFSNPLMEKLGLA